ncbi:hypothetical protein P280DRAFT_403287 [Massarina eburnea CBS 473.64]|uniref:NHL repeat-containing protein n=1 Tax=Massarina eburnea CBS 473.64 TaxID=1395130 RepID=A0A6A6RZH2_9PLEO|nr:hypothetical protein P280DRAFT_403287 [Massarina eburnea CBS 473.64]
MRFTKGLLQALGLSSIASAAAPTLYPRQSTTTSIYKFSTPKAAEGIATRTNGKILVSFFDKGELWQIDPATKKAEKVATFTDTTCSAAIAQVAPDIFAVVAGNYGSAGGNKPGSWGIWKVDFTGGGAPATTLLKKVPESGFWNGLTAFSNDTVLIGDASKGAVWRMNINTGAYSIAIEDASMKPSGSLPMGIDGVRYANGSIYYTNIFANKFYKLAVDAAGAKTGSPTTIWSNQMADDMYVTPDGVAYVAASGSIQKVTADGKASKFATVQSATAVTRGTSEADKDTLFIAGSDGTISSVKLA